MNKRIDETFIKKEAKSLKKKLHIKHYEALELLASDFGYQSWKELKSKNPFSQAETSDQKTLQQKLEDLKVSITSSHRKSLKYLIAGIDIDNLIDKTDSSDLHEIQKELCDFCDFLIWDNEYDSAKSILEVLAKNNIAKAKGRIGELYIHGLGYSKDKDMAFKLLNEAAELGDPIAQSELGCLYLQGVGCKKNDELAFEYFKKSAMQGCRVGQNNIACLYYNGEGVEKDLSNAKHWYEKAISNENNLENIRFSPTVFECMYNISLVFFELNDFDNTVKYLKIAAENNYTQAKYLLGKLLFEYTPNQSRGRYWLKEAMMDGHVGARRIMRKVFGDYSYFDIY